MRPASEVLLDIIEADRKQVREEVVREIVGWLRSGEAYQLIAAGRCATAKAIERRFLSGEKV